MCNCIQYGLMQFLLECATKLIVFLYFMRIESAANRALELRLRSCGQVAPLQSRVNDSRWSLSPRGRCSFESDWLRSIDRTSETRSQLCLDCHSHEDVLALIQVEATLMEWMGMELTNRWVARKRTRKVERFRRMRLRSEWEGNGMGWDADADFEFWSAIVSF